MSIERGKERLLLIEQEIDALINSEKYKQLEKKNRAWAVPKPTDQEQGEWGLLKEQLSDLEEQQNFWQTVLLNAMEQDLIRKERKKERAIRSVRVLLTSFALRLYSMYRFETRYETPTFGDVLHATQFKSLKAILDYFSGKKKRNPHWDALRNSFTQEQWIYFFELNYEVNGAFHTTLTQRDGKTLIVLPSKGFHPKLVQDAMEQMGYDVTDLDIQQADSE
jgi:hypothetical protein